MKFNYFGINFEISYIFLCFTAVCVITGMFEKFIYCFFAVAIHEAGHLTIMYKYRCLPDKLKISLFEISISDCKRQNKTFKENFFIIFFGPFANFVCFIMIYLLYLICGSFFKPFAVANLCIFLFNILPVMSLDGGQLVYLVLRKRFTEDRSEKYVNILTFIILFPLAAMGFLLLFNSKYNISLLMVCVYIVFSLVCRNNRYY